MNDEMSLAEKLARYFDPSPFDRRKRSSRNSRAAHLARKHQLKLAKTAIRFFKKQEPLPVWPQYGLHGEN